jgi:hypothetical protein
MNLIIIIVVLVLLFGGGLGGYHSGWYGTPSPHGYYGFGGLGVIVAIILIAWLLL